jgi:ribosomal protein S18 acetylase RimI-like enzyme
VRKELHRGIERMQAATVVLQRTRLLDPLIGIWDAPDVQWWWRRPRPTDEIPLPVWYDDRGPVAVALLTDWGDVVQGDALVVPGVVPLREVWDELLAVAPAALDVLARDDDAELLALLADAGFAATDERSASTWLDADRRPAVASTPEGYRLVDRTERRGVPHPMRPRNGDLVEERLRETSLYDERLDLSVETSGGEPVGYALFWHVDTTGVGQLEPMRVFDDHQRRGLARALLTEGLDRLARRGARRLKVGFDGPAGQALYIGAGFVIDSWGASYRRHPSVESEAT